VGVVVLAQLRAERPELADVDLAPVAVEQLDEAAHVRALALVRDRDAHVDLGHGVLQAVRAIEHADGIAQALHARPVERNSPVVPLAVDVAQRRQAAPQGRFHLRGATRLHSSSSPRRTVTALPPIHPRTLAGPGSGRTSTSTRPGLPISSPWRKTSRRGSAPGRTVWIST